MIPIDQLVLQLVASILIIFVWTLLWKVNPSYIFAESVALGSSAALSLYTLLTSLQSNIAEVTAGFWWRLLAFLLGLFLFTGLTRYRWMTRYGNMWMTAAGMGVLFGLSIRAQILDQVKGAVTDFTKLKPDVVGATLGFITVIVVAMYFLLSFIPKGKTGSRISTLGIWLMAIAFGQMWCALMLWRTDMTLGSLRYIIDFIRSLFS